MSLTSIRAEMENEQTWRQDEIRFLRNQLANISSHAQKMQYRRSGLGLTLSDLSSHHPDV